MQHSQQFISVRHIPNPGIPRGIFYTVAKTRKDERDDEDWIWRVHTVDDVGKKMASWTNKCHPALTERTMEALVQECSESVAHEWR